MSASDLPGGKVGWEDCHSSKLVGQNLDTKVMKGREGGILLLTLGEACHFSFLTSMNIKNSFIHKYVLALK